MTDTENYCFDVFGYLIIRNVLTSEEVCDCVDGLVAGHDLSAPSLPDPFARLRDHNLLAGYLDALMTGEREVVGDPWVIGAREQMDDGCLVGGNEPRNVSRMYHHQNGVGFCQNMLAIWALSDVDENDGGLALVPASHRSQVKTPRELITRSDDMDVVRQPALKAGDLILCAASTLHGFCKSQATLVAFHYASDSVQIAPKHKWGDWVSELTPLQQAVFAPEGGTPPVISSDGEVAQLETDADILHPATLKYDADCGIDAREFYLWDLCGHVVLKNVMDTAWLNAANRAMDICFDHLVVGDGAAKEKTALSDTGVPSLHDVFELPKPHCDPFREMAVHPSVILRLNWMMGSGFRCRDARAICSAEGWSGHRLHSGADPIKPKNTYMLQNGRVYCDSINVAWQLRDVCLSDGGFMCIPGSHKARYPVPPDLIASEETMDMPTHVAMDAGDLVMFLGAAQTHGAFPWKNPI
ncbi:MAG: hypothetical protein HOH77_21410, partial [Candidatus Latescibacteria bacterium]|nr:hypothetical protein [Candidatus Latescibacterota bacterium]